MAQIAESTGGSSHASANSLRRRAVSTCNEAGSAHKTTRYTPLKQSQLQSGFDTMHESALDILSDLLLRYIGEIGATAHNYAELSNRTNPSSDDLVPDSLNTSNACGPAAVGLLSAASPECRIICAALWAHWTTCARRCKQQPVANTSYSCCS